MPRDWEDEEERNAFEGRAGRAVSRLKAVLGDSWPGGSRPDSMEALRELREEIIERLLQAKEARPTAQRHMARDLFEAGPSEAGNQGAAGEWESCSGAAAISADVQPGAVSSDVAECLWSAAQLLTFAEVGDM